MHLISVFTYDPPPPPLANCSFLSTRCLLCCFVACYSWSVNPLKRSFVRTVSCAFCYPSFAISCLLTTARRSRPRLYASLLVVVVYLSCCFSPFCCLSVFLVYVLVFPSFLPSFLPITIAIIILVTELSHHRHHHHHLLLLVIIHTLLNHYHHHHHQQQQQQHRRRRGRCHCLIRYFS